MDLPYWTLPKRVDGEEGSVGISMTISAIDLSISNKNEK